MSDLGQRCHERALSLRQWKGSHGEDVKECYLYVDATPTASYLKMPYKYPQAEFPYADLIAVNAARGKSDPEYELLDTVVFDENRYFDVVIEHAKAAPEDLLMQVTVHNRGLEDAELHVLPTLWFRHTWSWARDRGGDRHVVVVNLSGQPAQARIPLDWPDLPDRSWQLTDILGQNVFERDGGELASPGLFVDLGPWQFHLLALQ